MRLVISFVVSLALVLSLSLVTGLPAVAGPATWYVDASVSESGNGTTREFAFKTITEAITVAGAEETIHVYPGTYYEVLTVSHVDVAILAVDEAGHLVDARDHLDTPPVIIDGGGDAGVGANGAVVRIEADGVRLEGFAVQNGGTLIIGPDVFGNAGIGILSASRCVIKHNLVRDSAFGVAVMASAGGDADENLISENFIIDNVYRDNGQIVTDPLGVHTGQGVRIDTKDGFGGATGNTIEGNRISGSRNGIYFGQVAAGTIVTGNEILENYHFGIHIYKSDGNVFTGNYIFNNGIIGLLEGDVTETQGARNSAGVRIAGGRDNTFTRNEVYNEVETSGRQVKGFRLFETASAEPRSPTGNVINHNDIYGHTEGTFQYGIDNRGYHDPDFEIPVIDARYNWWGHQTGPDHDVLNPGGQGDAVSDHVHIGPWLYRPHEEFVPTAPCYAGSVLLTSEATPVTVNNVTSYRGGWNSFSTPIALDSSANTVSKLLAMTTGSGLFIERAQRFDPVARTWVHVIMGNQLSGPDYAITPGEGFFIQVRTAGSIPILVRTGPTGPSELQMVAGWNLVALSSLQAQNVTMALYGVEYSRVLSPKPPNCEAWEVPPDAADERFLQVGEAYWVAMSQPGILFGMTTTPVEDDMTWDLNQIDE